MQYLKCCEKSIRNKMSKIVSQRTCIGCRTKKNKQDLIRIIVGENKKLVIDSTGKASGRGTYVCKLKTNPPAGGLKLKTNEKCLEMAIEKKAFQRVFKKKVNSNNLWQSKEEKLQRNQDFSPAPQ